MDKVQLKNFQPKLKIGKVNVKDKNLVDVILNCSKTFCKVNKEIKINIEPATLTISSKDEGTEILILIIYLQDTNKVEVENINPFYNFSIIVDALEFYKAIQSSKEFQKKITLEFDPNLMQISNISNIKLKLVLLTIKMISDQTGSIFKVKEKCSFVKEKSEFKYEMKNHFFKLNSRNIETLMTTLKYYQSECITLVLHEKTISMEVMIDEQKTYSGNCDFLIQGDNHNYERSFKDLCSLKNIPQKEISRTILKLKFNLKTLRMIGSKILKNDEYFYLTYDENQGGVKRDTMKSHFSKTNINNKEYEVILLSTIDIEKSQEDSRKKVIVESIKHSNHSDLNYNSNMVNNQQSQKSVYSKVQYTKNSYEEIEKGEEKKKVETNIKSNQTNDLFNAKKSQAYRTDKNEPKQQLSELPKKKELKKDKFNIQEECDL